MQFRYRLSKFSIIGVVVVVFGVTVMLVNYSSYHKYASKLMNEESKAQPALGKSFKDYKPLGADNADRDKKIAKAKSSFRWGVGAGLLIVVVGSVIMALPARNSELPQRKSAKAGKSTKPAAKSGSKTRTRRTYNEEDSDAE